MRAWLGRHRFRLARILFVALVVFVVIEVGGVLPAELATVWSTPSSDMDGDADAVYHSKKYTTGTLSA